MRKETTCGPSHCRRHALLEAQRFNARTEEQRERAAQDITALLENCRGQGAVAVTISNDHGEQRDGMICAVDWRETGTTPLLGSGAFRSIIMGFFVAPPKYQLPPPMANTTEI